MRNFFTLLLSCFCLGSLAQCPYDFNGDGVINFDGDLLFQLSEFGLSGEALATDHNFNGLSDIRDHLLFTNNLGSTACPTPIDQSDHILNLVLTEYYVHEEDFNGVTDTIPAGSVTYRLYVELSEEDDQLLGIYGDALSPLIIESTGGFHIHQIGGENSLGTIYNQNINLFSTVWPEVEFTSWLTIGAGPDDPGHGNPGGIPAPNSTWFEDFENGEDILMDSEVGSGVFNHNALYIPFPEGPGGLQLIGQFTTLETSNINGSINAYVRSAGSDLNPGYAIAEGLTFTQDNLSLLGCTDFEATNYNPEADYEDGSCIYAGDFNGDDVVSIADLLIFMEEFGCLEVCGGEDLNSDGIVNVPDLILFLGLIQ